MAWPKYDETHNRQQWTLYAFLYKLDLPLSLKALDGIGVDFTKGGKPENPEKNPRKSHKVTINIS